MNIQDLIDKQPFKLSAGAHMNPSAGMCVMEMVGFLQGEEWTDHPDCVCPVIAAFSRSINDDMPQEHRDRLQTYVGQLAGTVSPEHELKRGEFLLMKSVNVFCAMALDAAGLTDSAQQCRDAKTPDEADKANEAASEKLSTTPASHKVHRLTLQTAMDVCSGAYYANRSFKTAEVCSRHPDNFEGTVSVTENSISLAYNAAACATQSGRLLPAAWPQLFKTLDELLAIGPSGQDVAPEKIAELEKELA